MSNVALEESRPRYNEGIEILIRRWTEDRFSFDGKCFKFKDVTVVPRPVQKPIRRSIPAGPATSLTRWQASAAGEFLCRRCCRGKFWSRRSNIYKAACAASGHEPNIVYIRPVYIDEDEKQIRKEVEQALHNFLAFNASPVDSLKDPAKKPNCSPKATVFTPAARWNRLPN